MLVKNLAFSNPICSYWGWPHWSFSKCFGIRKL